MNYNDIFRKKNSRSRKRRKKTYRRRKYKYLIGLAVNNLSLEKLNARFSAHRINSVFYFLRNYLSVGALKSDYLVFLWDRFGG